MSFLTFQLNEATTELIKRDAIRPSNGSPNFSTIGYCDPYEGFGYYRYRLTSLIKTGTLCLRVTKFASPNGPTNLRCAVSLTEYSTHAGIGCSSNIVFGYPQPLKVNQSEEELAQNCPRIHQQVYVRGGDYCNVLDIQFFIEDNNKRTLIHPGQGWLICVSVVSPEKPTPPATIAPTASSLCPARASKVKTPTLTEPVHELSLPEVKKEKKKKEKIPAAVKNTLWYNFFQDSTTGKCQCCKIEAISKSIFDAGHIISEATGGKVELSNLRPICKLCNSSMGKMNMDEFIKKYGF